MDIIIFNLISNNKTSMFLFFFILLAKYFKTYVCRYMKEKYEYSIKELQLIKI